MPSFVIDNNGIINQVNEGAKYLTGYLESELVGQPIELFMHADLSKKGDQQSIEIFSGEQLLKMHRKDSQLLSISIRVSDLSEGFLLIVYDNQKMMASLQRETLENTHRFFKGIDEPYWEWNISQGVMFFSANLMSLIGYPHQDHTSDISFLLKHVDPVIFEAINYHIEEHLRGLTPKMNVTYPFTSKDGTIKWLTVVGKVLGEEGERAQCMVGTVKDVTDSKVLIKQLKKQNDFLMLAEKISNSGHWRYDLSDGSVFWSTEMYRIYGVNADDFTPCLETIINFHGDDIERQDVRYNFDRAITEIKGYYNKSTISLASGRKVKIENIGEVELNNEGKVIALFGICRDITKSEEVFEKLKLLAMVNYTIKVPIFFIDDDDNVVYQDLSPQSGGENTILFNYINFSIAEYMDFKKRARLQGQLKKNNVSFDKYNTVFDLSVTYEADEGIYIWIVENVTEKFRQEQQQIISNRLALLGNTFGNVSHDINNVLGVALGAIEMLEIKFSRKEDISTYIDRVKNAIDKGKNVTERLLAFTRKPTIKVVSFDPLEEMRNNKYLFKQLLLSTISLNFDLEKVYCLINFPQGEFINILLNLVLNAQDAIQEKGLSGRIDISANLAKKNRLEIHVKDSGIGIADENLNRVFDPFYSSKSVNKGNGIGLANVFSTMYKHNGHIEVEGHSELGGAHFTLVFKCKILNEHYQIPLNTSPGLDVRQQRVLILDDEVSIADFVGLYLENEGAEIITVNNKVELVEQITLNDKIDIFITDMILPDLSGREAVNLVLDKFPKTKIFSISGYIAIEDRTWEYPVLRKPFNSKELAEFLAQPV